MTKVLIPTLQQHPSARITMTRSLDQELNSNEWDAMGLGINRR